jgi:hypothetical protein
LPLEKHFRLSADQIVAAAIAVLDPSPLRPGLATGA